VLPADVDRIVQVRLVVRAHIQQDRQAMLRRNARERRVERHLSDRNAHAACALVAQSQDALTVAHHDATHIVVARVGQDLVDAFLVWKAQEQSTRLAPYL
jgi:hypothetical protein